ncbi:MAG: hypothetical protein EBT22_00195 [Chloroflexi bacterium]|nr:hypothetical protein [Chloroflexota bacterium]
MPDGADSREASFGLVSRGHADGDFTSIGNGHLSGGDPCRVSAVDGSAVGIRSHEVDGIATGNLDGDGDGAPDRVGNDAGQGRLEPGDVRGAVLGKVEGGTRDGDRISRHATEAGNRTD